MTNIKKNPSKKDIDKAKEEEKPKKQAWKLTNFMFRTKNDEDRIMREQIWGFIILPVVGMAALATVWFLTR